MEEKTPVGSNAPIEESTEKKTSPSAAPAAGGSLASRWDWGRAGYAAPA